MMPTTKKIYPMKIIFYFIAVNFAIMFTISCDMIYHGTSYGYRNFASLLNMSDSTIDIIITSDGDSKNKIKFSYFSVPAYASIEYKLPGNRNLFYNNEAYIMYSEQCTSYFKDEFLDINSTFDTIVQVDKIKFFQLIKKCRPQVKINSMEINQVVKSIANGKNYVCLKINDNGTWSITPILETDLDWYNRQLQDNYYNQCSMPNSEAPTSIF